MDSDFMSYIAVLVFGVVIGFIVGQDLGRHMGASDLYEGEWVCEVALGEVHCGPAE